MTKILMCRQAHWCKYLYRFNLIICFHPRKLRTKPNSLARQVDVYLKEGNSNYASINPQNYHLVFHFQAIGIESRVVFSAIPESYSIVWGDGQSVVHLLIGWCAKGGSRMLASACALHLPTVCCLSILGVKS